MVYKVKYIGLIKFIKRLQRRVRELSNSVQEHNVPCVTSSRKKDFYFSRRRIRGLSKRDLLIQGIVQILHAATNSYILVRIQCDIKPIARRETIFAFPT